jgi:hypothetical protein
VKLELIMLAAILQLLIPKDKPAESPFDAGYKARASHKKLSDNPYPPRTAEAIYWENGFTEAEEDLAW